MQQARSLAAMLVSDLVAPGGEPDAMAAELLRHMPVDAALLLASLVVADEAANTLPEGLAIHRFVLAIRRAAFGPAHPAVAATLQRLADGHRQMDQFQEAAPLLREAVAICEAAPGQAGLAACLADWGAVLAVLADSEAEPILRQALARQQAEGAAAMDVVATLDALRSLAQLHGDDETAWHWASAAVVVNQAGGDRDQPGAATVLFAAGQCAAATGRHRMAAQWHARALAILAAPDNAVHPDRWRALLSLGRAQMSAGVREAARRSLVEADQQVVALLGPTDLNRLETQVGIGIWLSHFSAPVVARVLLESCLTVLRVEAGPPRLRIAALLLRLADGHWRQGEDGPAQANLVEALTLQRAALGHGHPALAATHLALGELALGTGQYVSAQAHFDEGLALQRQHGAPGQVRAALLGGKARLLSDLGDHAAAMRMQREAVQQFADRLTDDHADTVQARSQLALIAVRCGAVDLAAREAALVLAQRRRAASGALGLQHAALADALCESGALAAIQGEPARSAWCFAAAADLLDRLFGRAHPQIAGARLGQAAAALARDVPQAALDFAASGLSRGTARLAPEHDWQLCAMVADALAACGRPEAAIYFSKRAVNRLQHVRTSLQPLGQALQARYLGGRSHAYQSAADRLIGARRLAEAQQVVAMLKAAELREGLRGTDPAARWGPGVTLRESALTPGEAAWQAEMERLLATVNRHNDDAAAVGGGLPALPAHQAELAAIGRQREAAERAWLDWARHERDPPPSPATQASVAGDTLGRLRAHLQAYGAGAVALDYLVLADRVEIIVTTATEQAAFRIAIEEAALNRLIFAFWSGLRRCVPDVTVQAQRLYHLLIAPVADMLRLAGARLLSLSLTGALRYVPFAALHDGGRFLSDVFATLVRAAAVTPGVSNAWNAGPAALFGSARGAPGLPALAFAVRELEAVAASLPGATVLLDDGFTTAALRDALAARPAVLHLATHFSFLPAQEAESWLLLGDGSRLAVTALFDGSFDLRGIEMLTLSACETAMAATVSGPEATSGREVESLPAALLTAGVGSVLASLWPVDDSSTAALMRDFYQRWRMQGVPAPEALRQAQCALAARDLPGGGAQRGMVFAEAAVSETPGIHPHQWAAFVLFTPG